MPGVMVMQAGRVELCPCCSFCTVGLYRSFVPPHDILHILHLVHRAQGCPCGPPDKLHATRNTAAVAGACRPCDASRPPLAWCPMRWRRRT